MFCKSCGKKLEDGVKFCDGCGARVETSQSGVAQKPEIKPEEQMVQPAPQTIQQTYTQPSRPAVAPVAASAPIAPAYDPPLACFY